MKAAGDGVPPDSIGFDGQNNIARDFQLLRPEGC